METRSQRITQYLKTEIEGHVRAQQGSYGSDPVFVCMATMGAVEMVTNCMSDAIYLAKKNLSKKMEEKRGKNEKAQSVRDDVRRLREEADRLQKKIETDPAGNSL